MSSFYPAVSNRTSTALATSRMLFQVNNDQFALLKLQLQLSTGLRFQRPSENPSSAIKVLSSQRQQEFRKQTEVNLRQSNSTLAVTETNLAQSQSLLNQVRSVAVEAANNTLSSDQRTALLNQVDGVLGRLANIANSKFGDQYIFAGSKVRQDPLVLKNDTVRFSANDEQLNTISDYNTLVTANVTAQEAFGVKSNQVVGTVDLNPAVSRDTPLSILNSGEGVRLGAINISSGIDAVELDLTNSHNLGEVIDQISAVSLGGRELIASLSSNGINIQYADGLGGLLRVDNVASGAAASDLGIANFDFGSASPIIGADLNPSLTLTTPVSMLFGGAGLPVGASFKIHQGTKSYVVNSNSIQTVEDLLNRIERTGASVETSIDPSGRFIAIQSTESGTKFSISENGGDMASSLGIRTLTLDSPLSALNNGNGIYTNPAGGDDLIISRNDGTTFRVSLAGAQQVRDVLDRINNHASNFSAGTRITASLSNVDNKLVLSSLAGSQPIEVTSAGGSQAATGLGWTSRQSPKALGTTGGLSSEIAGADVSGVEVEGVFTSIIKLRKAIASEDYESMEGIWGQIDQDLERLSIARGFVGSRQQEIESRLEKSEDEVIQLKEVESDNIDADLASVISELTQRQAAMTASLQLLGQTARTTLLDYL
jgi:flagellar hook-associated protein 3 FlgL